MKRILPAIDTPDQHQYHLQHDPECYRPQRCPRCGKNGLHRHGSYERNVPYGEGLALRLGSLFIPRFRCPGCGGTCSRLPGFLSPRRHYSWKSQEVVLILLLTGLSVYGVAAQVLPSRHTLSRWWQRLQERFDDHSFHLRSRISDLGRHVEFSLFWRASIQRLSLGGAMGLLDREGVIVP